MESDWFLRLKHTEDHLSIFIYTVSKSKRVRFKPSTRLLIKRLIYEQYHFRPWNNSDTNIIKKFYFDKKLKSHNKKHSENADTCTLDLVAWPWPFVKVKKADVIRCRFFYGTLVPGMMSMGLILYEVSHLLISCDLWPSAFVKVTCTLFIKCIYVVECFFTKKKVV